MKKLLALFISAIILSGCSVPVKKVSTSSASKIAIATTLANQLDIETIGTTVFNNKSMKGKVTGTPLPTRIKAMASNAINSSNKARVISTNGSLDLPSSSITRSLWAGTLEIKDKATLIQKAKGLGANLVLLITGDSMQDPIYGSSAFISNIGVTQRSVFGLKRATSHAILNMIVLDTKTSAIISEKRIFVRHPRAGKPWITPRRLPSAAETNEIISQLPIKKSINSTLSEMGLR